MSDATAKCQFYCLSFDNKSRKDKMIERFKKLNIECKFYSGVMHNDIRIPRTLNNFSKRQWSITYGHLDMIHDFYYFSNKQYAIICEDDIMIHMNFKKILKKVINDFNILDLNILLMGYLLPYKISEINMISNFKLKHDMPREAFFKYHDYPEYLSGNHMYMITKSYAKHLIKTYYLNYAGIGEKHFIPDKILIKDGNKALIYPMIAIEDDEQSDFYHQLCHGIHYTELYI